MKAKSERYRWNPPKSLDRERSVARSQKHYKLSLCFLAFLSSYQVGISRKNLVMAPLFFFFIMKDISEEKAIIFYQSIPVQCGS